MTPITYRYFVRGQWAGPADEKPAVIGAKFLRTLDSLSSIDPLFSDWQINRNWKITEDEHPRLVPLDTARNRMVDIVEKGVAHDDFGKPTPGYGYKTLAVAGARGPRKVAFAARTGLQIFELSFGEHNIASDLTIVTYPLFKAALLAITAAWDAQWSYAQADRNEFVEVPVNFAPGVPGFRIDAAPQVPGGSDLSQINFSRSVDYLPFGAARRRHNARARNSHRTLARRRARDERHHGSSQPDESRARATSAHSRRDDDCLHQKVFIEGRR